MTPETENSAKSDAGLNPEVLLLTACLGAFAISTQSFWMDEAVTAIIAAQQNFSAWLHVMTTYAGSDQQMPLYMFGVWLWEKIWGNGEWALRAANLVCLAFALAALPRRPAPLLAAVLVSPFLWYYLDEARPYALQICSALVLLGAAARLAQKPEKIWAAWFGLGCVLLAGSSLLGMIWCGAFLAAAFLFFGREQCRRLLRENLLVLSVTAILLAALAAYYLWTLSHPSSVSQAETGAANFLFLGYELLGFAGLGPGREQIRADGVAAFKSYWPLLALQAAVTIIVLVAGAKKIVQTVPRRVWLGLVLVFGSALLSLLILGALKHFRVLGRHNAPLLTPVLLWLAVGLDELWQSARRRWLGGRFYSIQPRLRTVTAFRGTPCQIRFPGRGCHRLANRCPGGRAWWCADVNAGLYYGLPLHALQQSAATNRVWIAMATNTPNFASQVPPEVVVLSRPEQNDPRGQLRNWLAQHHYRLAETPHLFSIWRPQNTTNSAPPVPKP